MSVLNNYRIFLRKAMANIRISDNCDIKKIGEIQKELKNNNPNPNKVTVVLQLDLSLNKLIETLEELLAEDQKDFDVKPPSQTDIERWALKSAVLDYYRNLNLPGETIIIENPLDYKTKHEFAPDTAKVFSLWLAKLAELTKYDDANHYEIELYKENKERGVQQGGAFEKQLQRYREQFIKKMLDDQK